MKLYCIEFAYYWICILLIVLTLNILAGCPDKYSPTSRSSQSVIFGAWGPFIERPGNYRAR